MYTGKWVSNSLRREPPQVDSTSTKLKTLPSMSHPTAQVQADPAGGMKESESDCRSVTRSSWAPCFRHGPYPVGNVVSLRSGVLALVAPVTGGRRRQPYTRRCEAWKGVLSTQADERLWSKKWASARSRSLRSHGSRLQFNAPRPPCPCTTASLVWPLLIR